MPLIERVKPWWNSFSKGLEESIFPNQCGLCGEWAEVSICDACRAGMKRVPARVVAGVRQTDSLYWYEGRAAEAVRKLKYGSITALAPSMAHLIHIAFEESFATNIDWIVPVPIHWTRRFERGFNQSDLLAMELPTQKLHCEALKRIRPTSAQASLDRAHRLRSLQQAFSASKAVSGKRILLIDDVITTGATIEQCAIALKRAGANDVCALSFAAVP